MSLSTNAWDKVPLVLNVTQVSTILGVSESTVKRLARKGDLTAFKAGSKLWRFEKESLKSYVERRN